MGTQTGRSIRIVGRFGIADCRLARLGSGSALVPSLII